LFVSVPSGTVQEHAVNIETFGRCFFKVVELLLDHDLEAERNLVNGDLMKTGMGLKRPCHEALWEEESREPVGVRIAFDEPRAEHLDTQLEVLVPSGEWFE